MGDELNPQELAERTGTPVEQLRLWRSLGLIGHEPAETFGPEDVERARLIRLLLRRGIGLDAIAGAEKEQGFLARYIEKAGTGTLLRNVCAWRTRFPS